MGFWSWIVEPGPACQSISQPAVEDGKQITAAVMSQQIPATRLQSAILGELHSGKHAGWWTAAMETAG